MMNIQKISRIITKLDMFNKLTSTHKKSEILIIRSSTYSSTSKDNTNYKTKEEILPSGKRRKIIVENSSLVSKAEESSAKLFNTLMSEIEFNTKKKKIALEGVRLIEDALLANFKMEKLFILKSIKEVPEKIKRLMNEEVEVHRLGQKNMQLWSATTAPSGLIGIFPKPEIKDVIARNQSQNLLKIGGLPLTVICDNTRDPGNLGSILRTAAAAGCKSVLLSKGCVDPWDMKVLRGGSGAHFRIGIYNNIRMDDIGSYFQVKSAETDLTQIGIFLADSKEEEGETKIRIPCVSYTSIDYTKFQEIYLLLGNEAEGIGDDTLQIISSLKASFENSGVSVFMNRIHISLLNRVESLNVANAFGILTFEIRRQFDSKS